MRGGLKPFFPRRRIADSKKGAALSGRAPVFRRMPPPQNREVTEKFTSRPEP